MHQMALRGLKVEYAVIILSFLEALSVDCTHSSYREVAFHLLSVSLLTDLGPNLCKVLFIDQSRLRCLEN